MFGDGSIKIHAGVRTGLKFKVSNAANPISVYTRVPTGIAANGTITMSPLTLLNQGDVIRVAIGVQRFANNAWANDGTITMDRPTNGNEWTMTVAPGAANLTVPPALQTKSGMDLAEFEINGAGSPRIRIGQVTVRLSNNAEQSFPLGTGCSSVVIAQTGEQTQASTEPCSGRVVTGRITPTQLNVNPARRFTAIDISNFLPLTNGPVSEKVGSTPSNR